MDIDNLGKILQVSVNQRLLLDHRTSGGEVQEILYFRSEKKK